MLDAVGVTRAGKVVSAGQVNIGTMERAENIVQLAVSGGSAYAFQADGVLMGGKAQYASSKSIVVAEHVIAVAGGYGLIALTEDGHVQRCGSIQPRVDLPSDYRLFDSYDAYVEERIAAEAAQKQREQQRRAYREAGVCQHCGGAFKKSLFGSKCARCGVKKDY